MVADEIGPFPDDVARFGVKAGVVGGAETDVEAALFDDGRGGRVGVERMAVLRAGDVVQPLVDEDFAGVFCRRR